MIFGKDGDSCGKSGIGKTPQEHTRRGGLPSARGKRRLGRKINEQSESSCQDLHLFTFPALFRFTNKRRIKATTNATIASGSNK
ncbi:hypothetical protein Q9R23_11655 [Exiguobacterium sp. BRG2]|nr:hypothetical protein [Exiguobacterium sp. BRG2]MDT0173630.1 hypothetical protein [Exiguobacterium sp. BRG2]